MYPDVMVDLETTGTRPDRAGLLQIAAIKFNYETGEIAPEMFDRCMWVMPHRSWDESTRQWWGKNKEVLKGLQVRAEDPFKVMADFAQFVGYATGDEPIRRLWAKPSHFEHPFLESHFHDAGIPNPFHYRYVIDVNSWIRGAVHFDEQLYGELTNVPFEGPAHNALFDALHQLQVVLRVREHILKQKEPSREANP